MSSSLKELFDDDLKTANDIEVINALKIKYLGRKGLITENLKSLSTLPANERPQAGKLLNELKTYIEEALKSKESILSEKSLQNRLSKEFLDITVPGKYQPRGKAHPINQVLDEIIDIFKVMGFEVEDGPEVESDYYNFEALNIPKDHPARDMQDTFYVSDEIVLRTQTSPVQIRTMEKKRPPLRFISPGKVYRCDSDVSHTPMFHQVEGLMVDTNITFSHLKGVLETFLKDFFGSSVGVRFRPSFFPFTEPSVEVDISCIICGS
ncbi:MAG: phenylalanine--tRNA ligase subunit alpha, partial [Thermodesulfovibrionales bacterium]|nr:phenylalanine--tRNA ligase subunit alpha [Thermodesulfovibrionales bacterium]